MVVLTIILAFGRLKQEDCKFEGSLASIVRAYLNKQTSAAVQMTWEGLKEKWQSRGQVIIPATIGERDVSHQWADGVEVSVELDVPNSGGYVRFYG